MRARASVAGFALVALLSSALSVWAVEPASDRTAGAEPVLDRVDLGASEAAVAAQRQRWQARLEAARLAVVDAHLRSIEANDAYSFMRHRDRDRGPEKLAIMAEVRAAEAALSEAAAALDAVLESARRAGVPPGWLPDRGTPASAGGANGAVDR